MPRYFNTRKNKISICHPLNFLWLSILCLVVIVLLHQDASIREAAKAKAKELPPAPPPQRIFCIISTYGYRHRVAEHLQRTWVKHCDNYIFVSDDSHQNLEPAVFQHTKDKWQLMRAQLEYVYKYHLTEGDWFLYANDDNLVVIDNLRYMLRTYSPNELIYFGCKLRNQLGQVYMFGGSSMVFSRSALQRFVLEALPHEDLCSAESQGDAATEELGRCLSNVNVIAGDSRDEFKYHRFLPFETEVHLAGRMNASIELHKYFLDHSYYTVHDLHLPVSQYSISFHLMVIDDVYNYFYFMQNVNIFGVSLEERTRAIEIE